MLDLFSEIENKERITNWKNFATVRLYFKLIYFKVLEAQTRLGDNERDLVKHLQ